MMKSSSSTPIDIDTLMSRIRAEVARRKGTTASPETDEGNDEARGRIVLSPLPSPNLPKPQFTPAVRYQLGDFLALHDGGFIEAAYRGVLKRNADPQGRQHFLGSLRNGSLSKIEILGRLRYSPEGRRQSVHVKGLLPAFAMQHAHRLPVVGSLVAFATALLHLPRIVRNLRGFEGYQHQRNAELESAIENLAKVAEGNERQLDSTSSELSGRVETSASEARTKFAELSVATDAVTRRVSSFEEALNAEKSRIPGIEQRIAATESRNDSLVSRLARAESSGDALQGRVAIFESHKQVIDQHLGVISQSQLASAQLASTLRETLDALEKHVEGLGKALASEQSDTRNSRLQLIERMAGVEGRLNEHGLRFTKLLSRNSAKDAPAQAPSRSRFDEIYFAFEQRFRGSREDIRRRLSYYLPLLRESVVGKRAATVLDIGCGRGEWLELLRDEKISARGIDINKAMTQECIKRGLAVDIGDAIDMLRQLPDNAFGAVTGFHIIEHVSLDSLIELIEQAHRVVRPGGLVIFETPNPENVVIGACNFYVDPTHQRPLPPALTQFLVEAGGFADVVIHRVNANLLPQVFEEPGENDPPALRTALNYLRSTFLCAPDYSVVGHVA